MSRYHVTMTEAEVKEAFLEWLENHRYRLHTLGNVVYFSHDLMTGEMLVEMSMPLPLEFEDEDDEEDLEEYDYEDEDDIEGSPV